MMKRLFFILFAFVIICNGYPQKVCDSLYVTHKAVRYSCNGKKYTGYFDCIIHYRNVQVLPNIHKTVCEYTQHSWYSDLYDTVYYVRAVGEIINGHENGKWLFYNNDTDTLIIDCYYKKGKLRGIMHIYDKEGSIIEIKH